MQAGQCMRTVLNAASSPNSSSWTRCFFPAFFLFFPMPCTVAAGEGGSSRD